MHKKEMSEQMWQWQVSTTWFMVLCGLQLSRSPRRLNIPSTNLQCKRRDT